MKFFFPEFDYEKWYEKDEEFFRKNLVKFNETKIEHELLLTK
jgi:hypothetical protein